MQSVIDELTNRFSSLSRGEQIDCLVRFGHELTVAARDTYAVETGDVRDGKRLRTFNEIQHRVLGHAVALIGREKARYPDDVLVSIFLVHRSKRVSRAAVAAFERALVLNGKGR